MDSNKDKTTLGGMNESSRDTSLDEMGFGTQADRSSGLDESREYGGYYVEDYGMNYEGSTYGSYERYDNSDDSGPGWPGLLLGSALTAAGLYLIYRSVSGGGQQSFQGSQKGVQDDAKSIEVNESITIDKPAAELYGYWRELTNLPHIMSHLKTVEDKGGNRSHWVAKGPLNTSVAWDAEITQDIPNSHLGWRSLPDAQVPNEGSVRFTPALGGRGTEVRVELTYQPPLGPVGMAIAKLFGEEPSQQIGEDLRRFKQRMETGEVASTEGQSSGRAK